MSDATGMAEHVHLQLDCGVELAVLHLPERRAEALDMRMLAGFSDEPEDRLGLARLVEQTLDKGTEQRDGRALSDAFDELGAVVSSWCGRETSGFSSLCLPEFFERCVALHAEYLRTPTFPSDACEVALELARQELLTLEDDAQALTDKLAARQAFGPVLGRHAAGEAETLAAITRDDIHAFWKNHYHAGRLLVSAAGPLEAAAVADCIERHFAGFGASAHAQRDPKSFTFAPRASHHAKETEQEQISIALPGVPVNDPRRPAERLLLGVLSGGMSARLFTEVREKQGLVYWVGAWSDNPRGAGMLFVGASTTPERCDQTYTTLLRELDRVVEDLTAEEVERALAGFLVRADVRGDQTRARCSEQADDLIHYGRPVPLDEKIARLKAVRVEDVREFAKTFVVGAPRSVVTLGPRGLAEMQA
jgi:predicted Zn-dependent peptidase